MNRLVHLAGRAAGLAVVCLIRAYQVVLSPLLVGSCKFWPTCSDYCLQAVREWGVIRGGWMGLCRIARCRPFTPGGLDPVPRRTDNAPPLKTSC